MKPRTYEVTYKESSKINNSLTRLFQGQLKWWSRSYMYNFKKKFTSQNKIEIKFVEYLKVLHNNNGQIYSDNRDIFESLYLNSNIGLILYNFKDIVVTSVEKNKENTKIIFDANIYEEKKKIISFNDCEIYFDKETKGILKIILNQVEYNTTEGMSKDKKYKIKIDNITRSILFIKNKDKKLELKYYNIKVKGDSQNENQNKKHTFKTVQSFYITKVNNGNKIGWFKSINLYKPLYESFSKNKILRKDIKILLTKEEQEFIEKDFSKNKVIE